MSFDRKAWMKQWRKENRDRLREYNNEWYSRQPEEYKLKHSGYGKKWKEENFEKNKEWFRNYANTRYEKDIKFKIANVLRARLRGALKNKRKDSSAVKLLGVSVDEALKTIESKFLPGMTWENWGRGKGKWHLDHVLPLASFDLSDPKQLIEVCSISNLQPLWSEDNIRKGAKS